MANDAIDAANLLERIGRLIKTEEQVGDLYPAQWSALRYLRRANRFSRTPMALAQFLGTTRGTISQTLIALERKGLILRQPSERDRRSVEIALTAEGQDLLNDDPIDRLASDIDTALDRKPKQAREVLERILAQLIAVNDGRPFGQCKTCHYFKKSSGSTSEEPHHCALLDVNLSDADSEKICVEQEV